MSAKIIRHARAGTPPFVSPLLETLDRIQQRDTLRPEQLTERARLLLAERCGSSEQPVEAAFAHGGIGLLAGHTHYFDGFAVLMPIQQGAAVAVRQAPEAARSLVTFDGSDVAWSFDAARPSGGEDQWPSWVCLVAEVVRRMGLDGVHVEAAVVSTVPSGSVDAYLAALAVATARAVQALFAVPESTPRLLENVSRAIAACTEQPFSLAYPIAAEAGRPGTFTLVDTHRCEQLAVEAPPHDVVGWGLVDVGTRGKSQRPASQRKRREQAEEALELLQKGAFPHLTSFRDLEHRDLQRALSQLPRRLKPVVRYLVSENRRVQKLIAAVRRRDWQMLGALLLMGHAALRTDWRGSTAEADFVVEQAEAMSLDGIYGARAGEHGSCVLVVGRPFVVPSCLDRVKATFGDRFGHQPEVLLL